MPEPFAAINDRRLRDAALRSPVLNHRWLNPFRVLRIEASTPPAEAIWRSEELLMLKRAGLPAGQDDAIPWLPDVEEYEVHQAVQRIEEPLQRLTDQMLWFDFERDPAGGELRDLLADPTAERIARYLAAPTQLTPRQAGAPPPSRASQAVAAAPAPAPPRAPAPASPPAASPPAAGGSRAIKCPHCAMRVIPKSDGTCPSCRVAIRVPDAASAPGNGVAAVAVPAGPAAAPLPSPAIATNEPAGTVGESGPAAATSDDAPQRGALPEALAATARAVNQANLSLLVAAATFHGVLDGHAAEEAVAPAAVPWQSENGVRLCEGLQQGIAGRLNNREARDAQRDRWHDATARWARLLASQEFADYVRQAIVELNDELVTEDETDAVEQAVVAQLTDLIVGELKLMVIDGRYDQVAALLDAASQSGLNTKQWTLAFRPLRQLFETELRDLEAPASHGQAARPQDLFAYVDRLSSVCQQWRQLDPQGMLGLGQLIDDRVRSTFERLKDLADLATIKELAPRLKQVAALASAGSLRQQIETYHAGAADTSDWACFFCQMRPYEIDSCVVLEGKKETGRVTSGNTTTVYYAFRRNIVPRCQRCTTLHTFLGRLRWWIWLALLPAFLQLEYHYFWGYDWSGHDAEYFWRMVIAAGVYVGGGWLLARILAMKMTPKDETPFYRCSESKPYKELASEGFNVTPDFRGDAMARLRKS